MSASSSLSFSGSRSLGLAAPEFLVNAVLSLSRNWLNCAASMVVVEFQAEGGGEAGGVVKKEPEKHAERSTSRGEIDLSASESLS